MTSFMCKPSPDPANTKLLTLYTVCFLSMLVNVGQGFLVVRSQTCVDLGRRARRDVILALRINGWVEHSCAKHMPTLAKHLENVEIISARAKYEERFPDDPTQWKAAHLLERPSSTPVERDKCRPLPGEI